MRLLPLASAGLLVSALAASAQQPASSPSLDFEFFRARVQPVFTTKRPGNARCVTCHTVGTTMQLLPLSPGSATWNEEQSRKNFEIVRSRVVPGDPAASRLLQHPLAESAGGDPHHDGGKHWTSKDDPEYQMLAAWVRGETMRSAAPVHGNVRIIQTNSAGDNVHIIDPFRTRSLDRSMVSRSPMARLRRRMGAGSTSATRPTRRWMWSTDER